MTAPGSHPRLVAASLLAALALACGDNGSSGPSNPYVGVPPLGTPIAADEGTAVGGDWRFVAFPDSVCNDEGQNGTVTTSTTGIVISKGTSTDVVVFLEGGGACWDYATCAVAKTASYGPFGATEAQAVQTLATGSILDRSVLGPLGLGAATLVYVPYCTGDVHAGDKVTTYAAGVTWHHQGHANVMAYLKRLGATLTNPGKVVVAGRSAGGFGALANYPAFRWYWPNATSYLVDDSGPPFVGPAIPATSRSSWNTNWDLGAVIDGWCPDCETDLSKAITTLATDFPGDRLALLSYTQDSTIRFFYGTLATGQMTAADFETYLYQLAGVMNPHSNTGYFFQDGTSHTMLGDVANHTSESVDLADWLEAMIAGTGSASPWHSVAPPAPAVAAPLAAATAP
jgi:hypothetical protein